MKFHFDFYAILGIICMAVSALISAMTLLWIASQLW